jgi:hypothetical protein
MKQEKYNLEKVMNTEEQFKTELKALLKKYDAVMSIEYVYENTGTGNRGPYVNFYRHAKGDPETYFNWNTKYEDGE